MDFSKESYTATYTKVADGEFLEYYEIHLYIYEPSESRSLIGRLGVSTTHHYLSHHSPILSVVYLLCYIFYIL